MSTGKRNVPFDKRKFIIDEMEKQTWQGRIDFIKEKTAFWTRMTGIAELEWQICQERTDPGNGQSRRKIVFPENKEHFKVHCLLKDNGDLPFCGSRSKTFIVLRDSRFSSSHTQELWPSVCLWSWHIDEQIIRIVCSQLIVWKDSDDHWLWNASGILAFLEGTEIQEK